MLNATSSGPIAFCAEISAVTAGFDFRPPAAVSIVTPKRSISAEAMRAAAKILHKLLNWSALFGDNNPSSINPGP